MIGIELSFPTGRFHATPWGRNVNEGVPEWPPSSYRLARALVDVWSRKARDLPEGRFLRVLRLLGRPPLYALPPVRFHHIRFWQSSNEKNPSKRQLIFDPFATCGEERVLMAFEAEATTEAADDLQQLLSMLAFFGRSESWVQARAVDCLEEREWNCFPFDEAGPGNTARVACFDFPEDKNGPDCLSSLATTTEELLSKGRDRPDCFRWVHYSLPGNSEETIFLGKGRTRKKVRSALYALSSKVLPLVEETLPLAERVRSYLMGIHKRLAGGDPARVSPRFSGKNSTGAPLHGHRHAFFQPLDIDGDGRIDHLLVHGREPFDELEITALDELREVWQTGGRPDLEFVLMNLGECVPGNRSKYWRSATPFVTTRHHRKGRGTREEWIVAELLREFDAHGIPRPVSVELTGEVPGNRPGRGWWSFTRNRKEGQVFPGYGFRVRFDEPREGYFSLGALCHFGLGLFVPERGHEA